MLWGKPTTAASATFEYTRYVCGPISNISKYRSGAGYNNLTVAELKEMVDSGVDITENKKEVISKGDEFIKSGDSVNNSKTINKKFQIGIFNAPEDKVMILKGSGVNPPIKT